MKTLRVMNYEGFRVVSSVDVAAFLGRRHDLFVRRIERLIQEKDLRAVNRELERRGLLSEPDDNYQTPSSRSLGGLGTDFRA